MEQQYKIGDLSRKFGISRDALRFYEKKGVIHPEKQDNGYRSYSYKDVRVLMDIMFFRKYDFSLEEIHEMLHNSTYESITEKIEQKIEEETSLLEEKKRSLKNLAVNQDIMGRAGQYLGVYEVRPFPDFYCLDEDMLIDNKQIMELCYIYDKYCLEEENVEMEGQYMLVPAHAVSGIDIKFPEGGRKKLSYETCVYTVVESDFYSPSLVHLKAAESWARERGLALTGCAYAGYLVRCMKEGHQVYYIEIYLPIDSGH